ncbi:MAG TPA: SGNH/GDSL hydrolase family protein [Daejeonella sp.]|uniref:SGNH/GDSL hydrolase family protein n=1 Tax=Daejeonella sp. TaxID=2805397 RepID=UPI002ED8BDE4
MTKEKIQISRRALFRVAAHAGLASVLIPLGASSANTREILNENEQLKRNNISIDPSILNAEVNILTPSVIYASEGIETNIYFDNVIFSNLPNDLLAIDVTCPKGRQYDKFWRINPQAADTGKNKFKIEVSFAGTIIASKTSELIITGKNKGAGSSIKVLCIGDSTTAGGQYISIINTDYQAMASPSMTFLGSRGNTPNKHEGRGGWKFSQYAGDGGQSTWQLHLSGLTESPGIGSVYSDGKSEFTISEINLSGGSGYVAVRRNKGIDNPSVNGTLTKVSGNGDTLIPYANSVMTAANPFWNLSTKRLDFKKYLNDKGYSMTADDLITVHLGINDVFLNVSGQKLESIKADFDKMLIEFRAVIPRINIGLCITIPPSISQDAFAVNYASGQTLRRYIENYKKLVEFLLSNYDTPEMRNSRLYCIGFNHCIDRTNNFQKTTMKANARSTQIIETWGNGVHPDNTGYYQMGDTLYSFIKSLVS